MNFERRKRKSWSDSSGVSEIVGNLLILMITVVLFSTIIAYVNQIPVPELQTKADFSASIVFDDSGTTANLTITHAGGSPMRATMTSIILNIDSTLTSYILSEDASFVNAWWTTGIEWTKPLTGITMTSTIIATVYDMEKDYSVWGSQVSGGTGGNAPIILQRYVDSNTSTPTADPIKQHDDFSFYVKVIDLDNDLDTSTSGVWVDASDVIAGQTNVEYDDYSDGWFQWDFSNITTDVTTIDGKVLVTHARDLAGHEAVSSYTISVIILPSDLTVLYTDTETGDGGLPSYLSFPSPIVGHGFGVYGENISDGVALDKADVNDPRTTFNKDEMVFVRVASTVMTNVFGSNDLVLTDTRTGLTYVPQYKGSSTTTNPFYVFGSNGKSVVFEARFNTTGLPPSAYNMHIRLSSGGTVESVFQTDQTLIVQQTDSPITFIPTVWLYSDSAHTTIWGGKTTPFNVYDETHKIYASVKVQDAQLSPSPTVGEIRIDDMTGGAQLYGTPPADNLITAFEQSANGTAYDFEIDLRINNADQWLGGTNSYTLSISTFSDDNEGVYSLTKQVFVTASVGRMDFFVGADGIYSTRGGSTNFINPEYVYYIENNNFFTTRVLHDQSNSPSAAPMYYMTCMAVGDIDGDGDDDLLAGQYKPSGAGYVAEGHILYFENSMNSYGTWQAPSFITRAATDDTTIKLEWMATGDTNGDGDIDIAYATAAHKIFIYNNTYGGQATLFKTSGTTNDGVRKIALEDMNGDGAADLITLEEGEVYVYDLKRWESTPIASIPHTPSSIPSNIEDFDIADVNADGMLDIITVDPTSLTGNTRVRGVWVNNYTDNSSPTNKTLDDGFSPVVQYGELQSGDVESTETIDDDGMTMSENASTEPAGKLSVTMRLDTLSSDPDQFLKVRARAVGGEEAFYIWYSVDSTDGTDGRFNPVIVVSSTDWTNYTFRLPSSVASDTLFIRITDSLTTFGSVQDVIQIDYVAVQSDLFGSYMQATDTSPPSRYQVVGLTSPNPYVTARAANIDGDEYLEVIVARDGKWEGYSYKTPVPDWSETNSLFYVYGHDMTGVSPTLFCVADVNGDTYSDVIGVFTQSDIDDDELLSIIGVFVNLYPEDNWYVQIKNLYSGMLTGTEQGSILYMLVEDIMHEQS